MGALVLVLLGVVAAALSVAGLVNSEGGILELVLRLALLSMIALGLAAGVRKLRSER